MSVKVVNGKCRGTIGQATMITSFNPTNQFPSVQKQLRSSREKLDNYHEPQNIKYLNESMNLHMRVRAIKVEDQCSHYGQRFSF